MQVDRQNGELLPEEEDDDDEPPLLVSMDHDDTINILDMNNNNFTPNGKPDASAKKENAAATDTSGLPPCPVTILSGFLGSGKTTLIQYILRSPDHGKRIAVIENEFGQGLDVESLIARDGASNQSLQDLIELPNGCMCCTVKDSLVTTLEALVSRRADLDYILIECR